MPRFFATPQDFAQWLALHSGAQPELVVGFYKRGSGFQSLTWPQSVDEALCVGWIDGVRRGIDEVSYQIRFTPRKAASTWSAINIARVRALQAEGRMHPAGIAAFELRREAKSRIYAYEQRAHATLDAHDEAQFRSDKPAWKFFEAQPPGYRHRVVWQILSAKRPETKTTRLARLIAASHHGVRL